MFRYRRHILQAIDLEKLLKPNSNTDQDIKTRVDELGKNADFERGGNLSLGNLSAAEPRPTQGEQCSMICYQLWFICYLFRWTVLYDPTWPPWEVPCHTVWHTQVRSHVKSLFFSHKYLLMFTAWTTWQRNFPNLRRGEYSGKGAKRLSVAESGWFCLKVIKIRLDNASNCIGKLQNLYQSPPKSQFWQYIF